MAAFHTKGSHSHTVEDQPPVSPEPETQPPKLSPTSTEDTVQRFVTPDMDPTQTIDLTVDPTVDQKLTLKTPAAPKTPADQLY